MTGAVTDDELVAALGGALEGRTVTALRRSPYAYATSAPLEEVRVLTEDGGETLLILKHLARERLLGDAREAKPEFLSEPRREIETYRRILGPAGIGPRCLASDPARPWLLLEKVPGLELWQIGEHEVWEDVARWLGGLHARFAGRGDELQRANPHLLVHSAAWHRDWCVRARAAVEELGDARARVLRGALEGYDAVAAELAALPRTLVHGELYPSNVLVVRSGDSTGVFPVDWEMAAVGAGEMDLAALSGGFDASRRRRLHAAYLEGLGDARTDLGTLTAAVRRCRLHLALQWLGWSATWRPPSEHAHDWLGEALELTEELGLR